MDTMKLPSAYSARQLLQMLEEVLQREQSQWKPSTYHNTHNQVQEVTASQRNQTVQWFSQLNRHFKFYPETYSLSTVMLDKVLRSVKARPKYLKCIGIACFYIAAKTLEEDEMVPSTLKFVQQSGCGCSVAEVLRMERRVLDIIGWNLRLATPLDFLHILHASLLTSIPHLLEAFHTTPGRQLSLLTRKLEVVAAHHLSVAYPPSVLALAVLTLEIQQALPNWFTITHIMQKHLQVSDEELIRCTEQVSQILGHCPVKGTTPKAKCKKSGKYGTPTKKRKVAESDEDDDIYDGIKRLYSDEPSEITASLAATVAMGTCGGEHRQEEISTTALVSLQAVAN